MAEEKKTAAEAAEEKAEGVTGPDSESQAQETEALSGEKENAPEETEAEKGEEAQEKDETKSGKKKLFGKSDKAEKAAKEAQEKLGQAEERLTKVQDQLQRQMAEFDNFRKRTEKEKAASFEVGARSILEKLLPIVDSFERGLGGLSEEQAEDPFAAGMNQVYKQLLKMLEECEVEPITALGEPFDASLHFAVMHVEDEELPENTVVEEFQKGYTYRGTVIRYSMVKVAN